MIDLRASGTESTGTRDHHDVITGDRLAQMWPEVSRRLRTALEAQGIDRAAAEDLVSEAVTRALATGLRARDVDDFCRWAYRVARNLHVDWLRAGSRLATEAEAEEQAAGEDVTHVVEQRLLCESTLRWLATLPAGDRRAILAGLEDTPRTSDRREAVRLAVRRHRARARLLKLVGGLTVQLGAVRALLRSARTPALSSVAACGTLLLPGAALLLAPVERAMPPVYELPRITATRHVDTVVPVATNPLPAAGTAATPVAVTAVPAVGTDDAADDTTIFEISTPPVGDDDEGLAEADAKETEGEGICAPDVVGPTDCVKDAPVEVDDGVDRILGS